MREPRLRRSVRAVIVDDAQRVLLSRFIVRQEGMRSGLHRRRARTHRVHRRGR
ncbi:MAG: hypothetical protein M3419_05080 [Actinomycetota bacterium]|nr:hypothetical protein [Actinomycetota bacterium]